MRCSSAARSSGCSVRLQPRRCNLHTADSDEHEQASLEELFGNRAGGMTPAEFYLAFKSGQLEDTAENMMMLVQAIALLGNDPAALSATTLSQ